MRIQQLKLENFRGFKELTIDFPEKGNVVFIGGNGAGKSSVLDILGYMLNVFQVLQTRNTTYLNNVPEMDVKIGASRMVSEIYFSTFTKKDASIKIGKLIAGVQRKEFSDDFLITGVEEGPDKHPELKSLSLPVLAHYPTGRKVEEYPSDVEVKRYLLPQLKTYEGAWGVRLNFAHFVKWYVEEENKENREKIRLKDFDYKNPTLDAVRRAWTNFFSEIGANQYENLRVEDRTFNEYTSAPSSLVITKSGEDLNLTQLSDGERLVLSTVADIAHRLVIANPALDNPLHGHGIVLIDEIELHLHPSWQRQIVPALEATFPNIQFIMTTHSPQVISQLERENVFVLKDFKVLEQTPYTKGRDSNSILYDLFEVEKRPKEEAEEIRKLYEYIDREDVDNARKQLEKLRSKLGEGDVEMQRAETHLSLLID